MKVTNLITPDILAGIDDINRKCHAMRLPTPPVQFFRAEVREGDELVEVLTGKSNSWVRNAYNLLFVFFGPASGAAGGTEYGAGCAAMLDTGGAGRYYDFYKPGVENLSWCYNASANSTYGICVGTSDAAESFEHSTLQALIAHGTGAGQLSYGVGQAPTYQYNAETKKFSSILPRVFTNSSGSDITVKEIGLVYYLSGRYFLVSRDVLATPITVNNGQTLTITYTSEITYPA